jgi:hypothetical protein
VQSHDRITANLPSRDFAATTEFYGRLGFDMMFRNEAWMILRRGPLELEFFPHPTLEPNTSWFSACVRVNDLDAILADWRKAGLPVSDTSIPRLTEIFKRADAPRMFALVDADGSLLRVLDNGD